MEPRPRRDHHHPIRPQPRLASLIRQLLTGLADAVWTSACPVCRGPLGKGEAVCDTCRAGVAPLHGLRCERCTALLSGTGQPLRYRAGPCPECSTLPTSTATRIVASEYADVRGLLLAYKYEHNRFVAPILADHFAEMLSRHPGARAAEVVVPVPLHRRRFRERGFNQAVVFAEAAARALRIPRADEAVRRIRKTAQQATLRRRSRRAANVAGAFAIRRGAAVRGRRVLLVDDVITTGATVGACAEALLAGGAKEVFASALAHPFHGVRGDVIEADLRPF